MPIVWIFFIFIFGLFIGSFLNLLIDRLPRGEQVLKGRSHCDKCKKDILWHDLFPVVSWFVLKGRCRFCRFPIPFRNTLVELITGSLFIINNLTMKQFNNENGQMVKLLNGYAASPYLVEILSLVVISSLIVVFFVDLKEQIIPDEMILVGVAASLILNLLKTQLPNYPITHLPNYLFSAASAAGFFFLLYWITKKRGLGFGDVKLALLMGLFLGYPKIISALYIAFLTGAFLSVMLILTGKKRFGQTIPFGPFLVLGTLVSYFLNLNLNAYLPF